MNKMEGKKTILRRKNERGVYVIDKAEEHEGDARKDTNREIIQRLLLNKIITSGIVGVARHPDHDSSNHYDYSSSNLNEGQQ